MAHDLASTEFHKYKGWGTRRSIFLFSGRTMKLEAFTMAETGPLLLRHYSKF